MNKFPECDEALKHARGCDCVIEGLRGLCKKDPATLHYSCKCWDETFVKLKEELAVVIRELGYLRDSLDKGNLMIKPTQEAEK